MKKFWKFVGGIASMAAVAFGAYCVYKNVIAKKDEEDFDDFDDCFEEDEKADDADREYVSINITAEDESEDGESENAEKSEEETEDIAQSAE